MSEPEQTPRVAAPDMPPDLPAVEPPTAGFVVQLFMIPALIVAIVVVVYVLFGKIASSERSPADFLAELRSSSKERRWLAAHELALILPHEKPWQNDEPFAAALAAELDARVGAPHADDGETDYQMYLATALGEFSSPVVLATLRRTVGEEKGADEVRWAAIASLGRWSDRRGGLPDAAAVTELARAGRADERQTRLLAAFVLGATARPEAVEVLRPLLNDSDREVRYNAAGSLARLGNAESLDVLAEMLDLDRLARAGVPNDQLETVPVAGLESLARLLEQSPGTEISALRTQIELLAERGNPVVRTTAKNLLITLSQAR